MTLYGIDSFEAYLNDCDENHKSVNHLWLNDKFYQAICRFNYKELVDLLARFMAITTLVPNDELGKCLFKLDIAHYVRWKLLGPDFHKFIGMSNRLDVVTMLDAIFIHQNFRPLHREFAAAYSAVKNGGLKERMVEIKRLDSVPLEQIVNP